MTEPVGGVAPRGGAGPDDGDGSRSGSGSRNGIEPTVGPRRPLPPRRSFAYALLLGIAGAGLTLVAATRTWSLQVIVRPGLPDLRTARTGAAEFPLLVGLALVALAGAGALLATRGPIRRTVGGLLAAVGTGVILQAVIGRLGLDVGRAGAGATLWPIACVVGGAMIIVGGLAAATQGHRWPTMGSRYERRTAPPPPADPGAGSRPLATAGPNRGETPADAPPADTRAAWDALDRGDDPTLR